jgi:predicted dehydrogenase
MDGMKAAVVGCGMIAVKQYFETLAHTRRLKVTACADLLPERAERACRLMEENAWGRPRPAAFEEILDDPDIGLVLNLTPPAAHHALNLRALRAGKHVYTEKPLALTREEGRAQIEAAAGRGVMLAGAPDTFLGCGHQSARALLDAGRIGEPSSVTLFALGAGPDGYHEDPEWFFKAGAGPLLDMGVYYLTDAVHLLGPIRRVSAFTKITFPERTVLSEKKRGQTFRVDVPTHVTAVLEFVSGVLGTLIASFDTVGGHHLWPIEIHGTEGSMAVPDPNGFAGDVQWRAARRRGPWEVVEPTCGLRTLGRGAGAADLAAAAAAGRRPRASAELAYHVLDVCLAIYASAASGRAVNVDSTVQRPAPLPARLDDDITD